MHGDNKTLINFSGVMMHNLPVDVQSLHVLEGSNTMNNKSNQSSSRRSVRVIRPKPTVFSGTRSLLPTQSKPVSAGRSTMNSRSATSSGKEFGVANAYATQQRGSRPKFIRDSSRNSVRIRHRELLASISGNGLFSIQSGIALNPGLSASFPWLSTQAQSWERYKFHALEFHYFTRTGTTTPGSVIMAPDYDSSDSSPTSEQIMSAYEDVVEDAPWKDICCKLKQEALNALGPSRYIRTGSIPPNTDVKTYDAGNFWLAVIDGTAIPWGKLWVEYDVELITPQLPSTGGGSLGFQRLNGGTPSSGSILTGAVTDPTTTNSFVTVSGQVVTFTQAGQFDVLYEASGTGIVLAAPVLSGTGSFRGFGSQGVTDGLTIVRAFQCLVVAGTILTFFDTYATGTSSQLTVAPIPSGSN